MSIFTWSCEWRSRYFNWYFTWWLIRWDCFVYWFYITVDYCACNFCTALSKFFIRRCYFYSKFKVVAVSVVLHALIGLGKKLTPDKSRLAIALVSAIVLLLYPSAWMQILIIVLAGLFGFRY